MFLELCLQDGDLETANIREERNARPAICKENGAPKVSKDKGKNEKLLSDPEVQVKVVPTSSVSVKHSKSQNSAKIEGCDSRPDYRQGTTFCNMNLMKVNACMLKTFNRMKKRIGFLIYQFVLPAIQVSSGSPHPHIGLLL